MAAGWVSPVGEIIFGESHRELMNTHPLMLEDPLRKRANELSEANQEAITKMWLSHVNRQEFRERAEWQLNDNLYDVYFVGGWLRLVAGYHQLTAEGTRSAWLANHRVVKAEAEKRRLKPTFSPREDSLLERVNGLIP